MDRGESQVDGSWSQLPFFEHPSLVVTDRPGHPLAVCLLALFVGAGPGPHPMCAESRVWSGSNSSEFSSVLSHCRYWLTWAR